MRVPDEVTGAPATESSEGAVKPTLVTEPVLVPMVVGPTDVWNLILLSDESNQMAPMGGVVGAPGKTGSCAPLLEFERM